MAQKRKKRGEERIQYDAKNKILRYFIGSIQYWARHNVFCLLIDDVAWFLPMPDNEIDISVLERDIVNKKDTYQLDMLIRYLYETTPLARTSYKGTATYQYSNPIVQDIRPMWVQTVKALELSLAEEVEHLLESFEGRENFLKQ